MTKRYNEQKGHGYSLGTLSLGTRWVFSGYSLGTQWCGTRPAQACAPQQQQRRDELKLSAEAVLKLRVPTGARVAAALCAWSGMLVPTAPSYGGPIPVQQSLTPLQSPFGAARPGRSVSA